MASQSSKSGVHKRVADHNLMTKTKASNLERILSAESEYISSTSKSMHAYHRFRDETNSHENDDKDGWAGQPSGKKYKVLDNRGERAKALNARAFKKIVINDRHSRILDIYVVGANTFGELGLGNREHEGMEPTDVQLPRRNHLLSVERKVNVVQVACGGGHAIALTSDNKILTWGINDEGALGRVTPDWEGDEALNPFESTPGEVDMRSIKGGGKYEFVQVEATDSACFVLTDTGLVYGWGTFRGSDGVLGFTIDVEKQRVPILIPGLKDITSLAAGGNHMLALDTAGRVFTWGYGDQYQLGRAPPTTSRLHTNPAATLIPRPLLCCGEDGDGRRGCRFTAKRKNKHYAVRIAAGSFHSFYIDNRGGLWAWGLNNFAQTGTPGGGAGEDHAVVARPTRVEALRGHNVVRVDGGAHHAVACTARGEVFVWGRVDNHQLGLPAYAFTDENTLFGNRSSSSSRDYVRSVPRLVFRPTRIPNFTASFVAASSDTSFALAPDGQAYSWGFSASLQTGQGTEEDVETPTKVGGDLTGREVVWVGAGGMFAIFASGL
ncbi:RCC1/BLIP-II [Xylariomycetidae sp. FL2044]|nr:RCC1/BLIP-II [Xylariomycetidae sp. FL2044]